LLIAADAPAEIPEFQNIATPALAFTNDAPAVLV